MLSNYICSLFIKETRQVFLYHFKLSKFVILYNDKKFHNIDPIREKSQDLPGHKPTMLTSGLLKKKKFKLDSE